MIPAGGKGQADLRANVQCLEAELWSLGALPLLVFNLTSCTGGFSSPKCILCLSFLLPAAFRGSPLSFLPSWALLCLSPSHHRMLSVPALANPKSLAEVPGLKLQVLLLPWVWGSAGLGVTPSTSSMPWSLGKRDSGVSLPAVGERTGLRLRRCWHTEQTGGSQSPAPAGSV